MAESNLLSKTKAVLRSLVVSAPQEITTPQLAADYESLEGQCIPFVQLGYQRLEHFLESISDTLLVLPGSPREEARVLAVKSSASAHISKMVAEQNCKEKKAKSKSTRRLDRMQNYALHCKNNLKSIGQNINTQIQHQLDVSRKIQPICDQRNLVQPPPPPAQQFQNQNANAMPNKRRTKKNSHSQSFQSTANACPSSGAAPFKRTEYFALVRSKVSSNGNIAPDETISDTASSHEPCETAERLQEPPEEQSIQKETEALRALNLNSGDTNCVDAIPELSDDDPIFMVGIPNEAVIFGTCFSVSIIPKEIEVGSLFGIFITEVNNPFKFWFHIQNDNHELDKLMNRLEHCYKSLDKQELQVPHRKIMPGQICAARYLTQWHRAEFVCRLMDNENSVIVHFVDYGTTAEILLEDIRYLLHEFSTLPCQAFRGCMDYIRPAGHKWARDATYSFLSIVCEKMIYAKATNIDYKDRIMYLLLVDTNGEEDIQINNALIQKGYAKVVSEEEIALRKGLRHYSERHPTFAMLESGAYPSFAETGRLLAKGIDFEAIQDENVIPEVDLSHQNICKADDAFSYFQSALIKPPSPPLSTIFEQNMSTNPFKAQDCHHQYETNPFLTVGKNPFLNDDQIQTWPMGLPMENLRSPPVAQYKLLHVPHPSTPVMLPYPQFLPAMPYNHVSAYQFVNWQPTYMPYTNYQRTWPQCPPHMLNQQYAYNVHDIAKNVAKPRGIKKAKPSFPVKYKNISTSEETANLSANMHIKDLTYNKAMLP